MRAIRGRTVQFTALSNSRILRYILTCVQCRLLWILNALNPLIQASDGFTPGISIQFTLESSENGNVQAVKLRQLFAKLKINGAKLNWFGRIKFNLSTFGSKKQLHLCLGGIMIKRLCRQVDRIDKWVDVCDAGQREFGYSMEEMRN